MKPAEVRAVRPPLRRLAGALAFLVWAAGCGRSPDGPEPIRPAEDSCAECRMQIVQPRFAAQVLDPGGYPLKFDDIGCFLKWLGRDSSHSTDRAWVADSQTGAWIEARSAVYVTTKEATPMGSGILAFPVEEEAKAKGAPETLKKLLEKGAGR